MARPVKIAAYFAKRNPDTSAMVALREILMHLYCIQCGGYILWDDGYVMSNVVHSGGTNAWCSRDCLNEEDNDEDDGELKELN